MKKAAVNQPMLHLLVSVYNQSIQTYHHFPEVILCGCQRMEPEDFAQLLAQEFLTMCSVDSFGRNYRLSKKGEAYLFDASFRRRQRTLHSFFPAQGALPFYQPMA